MGSITLPGVSGAGSSVTWSARHSAVAARSYSAGAALCSATKSRATLPTNRSRDGRSTARTMAAATFSGA
jgi:hypothetical protein